MSAVVQPFLTQMEDFGFMNLSTSYLLIRFVFQIFSINIPHRSCHFESLSIL